MITAITNLRGEVADLLAREALALDQRRWDDWLDLFTGDAIYWVPAWRSEDETTEDPDTELSLMYMDSRDVLEERVFRIRSRDSFASLPLDRTTHLTSNLVVHGDDGQNVRASATWLVHSVGSRGSAIRGGSYEYRLRRDPSGLRIAYKRIVVIDDKLEGVVDFYHL